MEKNKKKFKKQEFHYCKSYVANVVKDMILFWSVLENLCLSCMWAFIHNTEYLFVLAYSCNIQLDI
jgi:hypothetical protein